MTDREIQEALAAPFPANVIEWKPQVVSKEGNKAMAVAYVDARAIMDRLDDVLGVGGWESTYETHHNGMVTCTLRVCVNGVWVRRQNIGAPSAQPSEGDKAKSAHSSALKRAAVELGIGRYLYRLTNQWVDYDGQKKQFRTEPRLPDWALPRPPSKGSRIMERLREVDAKLAAQKLCQPGELIQHVLTLAEETCFPVMRDWADTEANLIKQWVADFEDGARKAAAAASPPATGKTSGRAEVRSTISPNDITALAQLLGNKGLRWLDVREQCGFPRIEHIEDLTINQWGQVMALVTKMQGQPIPA